MPSTPSIKTSYDNLLREVTAVLSSGLINVQKMLEYHRVKTYWTIGKKIRQQAETSQGVLKLNEELYQQISTDIDLNLGLDLSPDTISRSIQFSKAYPAFPKNTSLTFTHYLALIRIPNVKKRLQLERQAIKKSLTSAELKKMVLKLNAFPTVPVKKSLNTLKIERGEPYIYYARPFEDLNGRKNMCIDCGFKIHIPINGTIIKHTPSFSKHKSRYTRVIKDGDDYDVRLSVRKRGLIYTYAARVLRIVDGDTLDALIDVGFGIQICERFRLKAINAPEIKKQAGLNAKQFLIRYLTKCPIIIVRTSKAGMYGRWLADIFAKPGCISPHTIAAEGLYLNQLMLDKGMAEVYK